MTSLRAIMADILCRRRACVPNCNTCRLQFTCIKCIRVEIIICAIAYTYRTRYCDGITAVICIIYICILCLRHIIWYYVNVHMDAIITPGSKTGRVNKLVSQRGGGQTYYLRYQSLRTDSVHLCSRRDRVSRCIAVRAWLPTGSRHWSAQELYMF